MGLFDSNFNFNFNSKTPSFADFEKQTMKRMAGFQKDIQYGMGSPLFGSKPLFGNEPEIFEDTEDFEEE